MSCLLKSFLSLSLGMCDYFLIFSMYTVVLNAVVFNVWLLKEEKAKNLVANRVLVLSVFQKSFQLEGGAYNSRGSATTIALCLFVCISVIRSRHQ